MNWRRLIAARRSEKSIVAICRGPPEEVDVRFGSKAGMTLTCARLTSKTNIDDTHTDVCFVPIADIDDSSLAMLGCYARQSDRQHSMERAVATGTVKWFNPTKGYGFIQPQSGGKDVFVHISALERAGLSTLNEGATVDYEIVSDRGKELAGNLKVRK